MNNHSPISTASLAALRSTIRGQVVAPDDEDYDRARRVWNASIDRHPALVARCSGVADVIAALKFASDRHLPVAVRGGGHSFAGFGTCDDGLVIDLSLMKHVHVDPDRARVTAQGGVTWAELDHETAAFGLGTTGGLVSTTGIAGLTLGGGIGWLMRKHGLACDNLRGAEVVTADGRVLRASDGQNPDLFWALRGGGGNFGVVTSLEYQLHPVTTVLGGAYLYPIERAADVLACYADSSSGEPDELCTLIEFGTAPDAEFVQPAYRGRPIIALALCYCGPAADGETAIARWRDVAPVVADLVQTMPYVELQSFFDDDYPEGLWSYMKSHYVDKLSGEVIDGLIAAGNTRPTARSFIDLHHLEGAPSRLDPDAAAFDHRGSRFALMLGGMSDDRAGMDGCRTWARQAWASMTPHATGGAYVNFLADTDDAAIRSAWSPRKYSRIAAVKNRYDPANRFRFNHNITPS